MVEYPIKVFVGCAPNGLDAESQMVLESSMRSRCDKPIDIVWMSHAADPSSFWYGWNSTLWKTPFSGFRWGIPEYCKFSGQAIYMDSDMIVMDDIDRLWQEPWVDGKVIMAATNNLERRTCVMKINCQAAQKHVPAVDLLKSNPAGHGECLMSLFDSDKVQLIDSRWNNIEGTVADPNSPCIVHYTRLSTQPHLKYTIPRLKKLGIEHWYNGPIKTGSVSVSSLFDTEYQKAIRLNYDITQYTLCTKVNNFDMINHRTNIE